LMRVMMLGPGSSWLNSWVFSSWSSFSDTPVREKLFIMMFILLRWGVLASYMCVPIFALFTLEKLCSSNNSNRKTKLTLLFFFLKCISSYALLCYALSGQVYRRFRGEKFGTEKRMILRAREHKYSILKVWGAYMFFKA
jgi:hypothetical protein